jgi:hypothetical protein
MGINLSLLQIKSQKMVSWSNIKYCINIGVFKNGVSSLVFQYALHVLQFSYIKSLFEKIRLQLHVRLGSEAIYIDKNQT